MSSLLYSIIRQEVLSPGTLVKRYKRFLADVVLNDGRTVTAHCANTGSMENLVMPGTRVWLAPADNPARKLAWTWMLAELDDGFYGTDTSYPNRMTGELLRRQALPFLGDWPGVRAEVSYGEHSRVDFLLENGDRRLFLEVKNCHLVYPDRRGYFPDSAGVRAITHLHELSVMAAQPNTRACVLFFAQVPTIDAMRPSDAHDPAFALAARLAQQNGVEFYAIQAKHTTAQTTEFYGPISVDLDPYDVAPNKALMLAWKDRIKAANESG